MAVCRMMSWTSFTANVLSFFSCVCSNLELKYAIT